MLFLDRLQNLLTGLGGRTDKKIGNAYALSLIDPGELHAMYREDWLAAKIVDIIPNDMTREGRNWQASKDEITAIEALEAEVNLMIKVNRALKMARLDGGAGILIGIRGDSFAEELDLDRIGKGSLEFLHVLSQSELTAGERIQSVFSPYYDEPEYYEVTSTNGLRGRVHPSRVVRFIGAEILDRNQRAATWGDSVLQKVYAAVQNATSSQEHIASLIPELKTDIIYMPGLSQSLSTTEGTKRVTDRFAYANTMKSMFRLLLLEGNGANGDTALGEKWEQKQISFSQMPELMQQYLKVAAGAADIPLIRLLQDAPSGLGANGDSSLHSYYDNIAARQSTELQPALNRLDEVIIRSALGSRPAEIHYAWPSLWQVSDKERAEIGKMAAETIAKLNETGLWPPEALATAGTNMLIEMSIMPGLEEAIDDAGGLPDYDMEAAAEEERERLRIEAANTNRQQRLAANDAAPRTLYVRRDVLNAQHIVKWAEGQGFTDIVPDLHVTIAYSRAPVDWFKVGTSWSEKVEISAGGPRQMERLGDDGKYIALLITANELVWRHREIVENGASWDWPDYQPHISIQIGGDIDLAKVEPYQGKIVLGPEIFEELRED